MFVIIDGDKKSPGTTTRLKLRNKHPWEKIDDKKFIESVKRVVPNPPFEIFIKTPSAEETYSVVELAHFDLNTIKDHNWERNDNVSSYRIEIDNVNKGLKGVCDIALITKKERIVDRINITSKEVQVDDDNYTLSMDMKYGRNCIEKHSDNIRVTDDGLIEVESSHYDIFDSKSAISIHGIEVPCKLIPDYTTYGEKALINFPLPIAFKLDIFGENDLNLNSARTKIIYDEKWLKFESDFYEVLLNGLATKLKNKKWNQLKEIIIKKSDSEVIYEIIKRI